MNNTTNSTAYRLRDRWEKFVGFFEDVVEWMIQRLCGDFEMCQDYLESRRRRRIHRERAL